MKILRFISRIWNRWQRRKLTVIAVVDLPIQPKVGIFYLVQDGGFAWAALMQCPCGCGDSITLNLIGQRPRWSAAVDARGIVTVQPSIWRTSGCRSHFWIRKGRVRWVGAE